MPSKLLPSLQVAFPSSEKGTRPIIAKTDGTHLILKRVRFEDGKDYDVHICQWDSEGNELPITEKTPFSASALSQIQAIAAKSIFNSYLNPSQVKIWYRGEPERCISQNLSAKKNQEVDLMSGYTDIVDAARNIHQLLMPESRMEWARGPNTELVIYPKRISPSAPEEKQDLFVSKNNEEEGIPLNSGHKSDPRSFLDASTSTDPELPPPSVNNSAKLMQEIDQASTELQKTKPLSFLKGTTYSQLAKYSEEPAKKPNDPLYPIYEIFKKIVKSEQAKNPSESDEMEQMKTWIQALYLATYRHYNQNPYYKRYFYTHDNLAPKKHWGVTFEDWCRHYAAQTVLNFIKVENASSDLWANQLKTINPT